MGSVGCAREQPIFRFFLDEALRVTAEHPFQELWNAGAHFLRELGHSAKVEKDDRATRVDEHVSGVRIGVIQAVGEDHLAVKCAPALRATSFLSKPSASMPTMSLTLRPSTNVEVSTRRSRSFPDGDREADARVVFEVFRDALDVVRFEGEVELLPEQLLHLVVVGVEPLDGDEPLHDRHDATDGAEIEPDDLVDVGVLNLHRDARAILEARLVHLTE